MFFLLCRWGDGSYRLVIPGCWLLAFGFWPWFDFNRRNRFGRCRLARLFLHFIFHGGLLIVEKLLVFFSPYNCIPAADVFPCMLVNTGVAEARIFVALEFEDGVVHQAGVEYTDGAEQFIRLVKRFSEITELTDEIVATFIQRVEVHETVKMNGKKQHEITVFYNFIGNMSE